MQTAGPRPGPAYDAKPTSRWRLRLHEIIFESDTKAGKAFDIGLLIAVLTSVIAVCLESVADVRLRYGELLRAAEWVFTVLFAIEYVLRLAAVKYQLRYATSFFGVIDLLAVLPTPISVLVPGVQSLLVVRVVRLLRVFRVLKLASFLGQAQMLITALRASRHKITVFLLGVLALVVIAGAAMYLVEGPEHGFDSIPRGMYWAIVTLTTVGFGDITPKTVLGQALASGIMVLGYGIIAVPTGIVSVELANVARSTSLRSRVCPGCGAEPHDEDAVYCKHCATKLD